MSILIKGMEMPKNCLYCRFCVDNEERMCTVCTALNKDFDNGIIVYENRRRDNCPLIELPPHGRLIDADEAYDEFLNLMKIQGTIDPCQLGRILVCAPTIIEAEDSFFNSLKRGLEQAINGDVREITITESEGEDG